MAIGAVMDPRFKMKLPAFCFPTPYLIASDSETNLSYLGNALTDLYLEYCREEKDASKEKNESGISSSDANFMAEHIETPQGINDYESFIRESGGILEPTKSELEEYLRGGQGDCDTFGLNDDNRVLLLRFIKLEDILPGPVSQTVILDKTYHVSSDVWDAVDRGPLECICGNRSMRRWFLSDAQKKILHAIGFGVFANPGVILQNDVRLVTALVERVQIGRPIPDESKSTYPVVEFWAMPDEDEEEDDEGKGKKGKVEVKRKKGKVEVPEAVAMA
ncbi:hypothetical protein ACET3Z_010488 [Daucus carota]